MFNKLDVQKLNANYMIWDLIQNWDIIFSQKEFQGVSVLSLSAFEITIGVSTEKFVFVFTNKEIIIRRLNVYFCKEVIRKCIVLSWNSLTA